MSCSGGLNETPSENDTITDAGINYSISCDSILIIAKEKKADTIGKITTIPNDLESCFLQLDSLFGTEIKEWIKCLPDGDFSTEVHMNFGMYLRNEWGLWKRSVLCNYFLGLGINHPDDMSGIIFDSYQRRLKGKDIKLNEQIKYSKEFYRISSTHPDSIDEFMKKGKYFFND